MADLSAIEPEPLVLAAVKSAKKDPSISDLSCILKKSLKNVSETRKALETPEPTPMATKEALSLKVHCGLSDSQYQMIKNSAKRHNADIYPSLHEIYQEKLKCYSSNIEITEISSKTSLQDMVNQTLSQIFKMKTPLTGMESDHSRKNMGESPSSDKKVILKHRSLGKRCCTANTGCPERHPQHGSDRN